VKTLGTLLPYLSGSVVIMSLSFLCVTALLEIRSHRRKGVFSLPVLVFVAVAISILTLCLILAADAVFFDDTGGPHSPWSDWGIRLGS
jgi:hypothetical protein